MKLGDKVKSLTDLLGIPQCGGCERRQQWLNDLGKQFEKKDKGDSDGHERSGR
jgi:hypothetical protein